MKKVLIALDYNPTAQKIAETGHELAKAMKAQTILLHVTADATYYADLNYSPIMGLDSFNNFALIPPDSSKELTAAAEVFLEKSRLHLGDDTIQTIVTSGDFSETILATANEWQVDIIVMGTHSRRGLDKILLGSVAEKVLHHSSIPLFIIPTKDIL